MWAKILHPLLHNTGKRRAIMGRNVRGGGYEGAGEATECIKKLIGLGPQWSINWGVKTSGGSRGVFPFNTKN